MIFLFKDYRRKLSGLLNELSSPKELILVEQENKEYQLHVEQDYLHLVDYNVNIYSGVFSNYTYTGEYEPDTASYFGHYIFYDNNTGKRVFERRCLDLKECIEVYLTIGLEGEYEKPQTDNIRCKYFFDNGKFLREKVIPMSCIESWGKFEVWEQ
ncbi:hypothetical protein HZF24_06435 [Sedimentibacter hydroxybenzoicus DSM 7310]|uniref:Uncharacterized protein n=1 Tax=Sedimentibacter hydroxybenzoicus DSM 7310 TaxID=1123245 RepID=A0A974GVU3_SEDHY|nr:hypothetical protein [Sedimentibacter hydroxybenzoicus]NYB73777.1 hypothetical protein [Sedimentibacter hydroxybenzoicus DSM 7310]